MGLTVTPLQAGVAFGAQVCGVDLNSLTTAESDVIVSALDEHLFLCFPDQHTVAPTAEARLARLFDPTTVSAWRDQETNPWERYKAKKLGGAGTFQLPDHPATLVIGKGKVSGHWGLTETLGGSRKAYGKTEGSQVIGGGLLQWHIDGAFWRTHPPRVTVMSCAIAPGAGEEPSHIIDYGDGASLRSPLGATAFCSAVRAYELLTPLEAERAERTLVRYASHPFRRFALASNSDDGLRCYGEPAELGSEAEEVEAKRGAMVYPLIWEHARTRRRALMPHTRCVEGLDVYADHASMLAALAAVQENGAPNSESDAPVVVERDAARSYLHTLMRRAIEPALCYPHRWREGDVCCWDNHAVWHSATGALRETDRRCMHLTSFDATAPPLPPTKVFGGGSRL